jgi:hypothetical protein
VSDEIKKKRERHVYGRIEWQPRNGKPVVFEQTEFGLMVHRKRSRQEPKILTFRQLFEMANNDGQQNLL